MPRVHREDDLRTCGHVTRVIGQDFVKIDNKLVAVVGDSIKGGSGGALISTGINTFVKIDGKLVIVLGDQASPDSSCSMGNQHCYPYPSQGADFVSIT